MRQLSKESGMIEYYLALGLFLILCACTAWIAQIQIKKSQLEKAAWQTQHNFWNHEITFTKQNMEEQNNILGQASQGLHQGDTLTASNSVFQTEEDQMINNGFHFLFDMYEIANQYRKCKRTAEPLGFVVMKKIMYRHQNHSLTMKINGAHVQRIDWVQNFIPAELTDPLRSMHTGYAQVNTPFHMQEQAMMDVLKQVLSGDVNQLFTPGFITRQVLWQEAMYEGKTDYPIFLPLQLVAVFELIKAAKDVKSIPIPGRLPWVKKLMQKSLEQVSNKLINVSPVKEFKNDIVRRTTINKPTHNQRQACSELSQAHPEHVQQL